MAKFPEKPEWPFDSSTHPRAELVDTTDWFLKLKQTEKHLDRTTEQYLIAQEQIEQMKEIIGWFLKIIEMIQRQDLVAAIKWLEKALIRFPWLAPYLKDKRIATDRLISKEADKPAKTS